MAVILWPNWLYIFGPRDVFRDPSSEAERNESRQVDRSETFWSKFSVVHRRCKFWDFHSLGLASTAPRYTGVKHSQPLFRLFNTVNCKHLIKKFQWLNLNRGHLKLEVIALPTEPQPLPNFLLDSFNDLIIAMRLRWSDWTRALDERYF